MAQDGHSAREIAQKFGITRNAVLGKLMRERLKRGEEPKQRPPKPKPPARTHYTRSLDRKTPPEPKAPAQIEATAWDQVLPDAPGLLLIEGLRKEHCRFPLNNAVHGVYYFCGEPHKEHSPYCEKHHAICYVKRKPDDEAA